MRVRHRKPEIVIRNGKPAAVIIDIEQYEEMLDRLQDAEDLKELEDLRSGTLEFVRLDDFLADARNAVEV